MFTWRLEICGPCAAGPFATSIGLWQHLNVDLPQSNWATDGNGDLHPLKRGLYKYPGIWGLWLAWLAPNQWRLSNLWNTFGTPCNAVDGRHVEYVDASLPADLWNQDSWSDLIFRSIHSWCAGGQGGQRMIEYADAYDACKVPCSKTELLFLFHESQSLSWVSLALLGWFLSAFVSVESQPNLMAIRTMTTLACSKSRQFPWNRATAFHEGVEKFTGFGQSGAGATYFIDWFDWRWAWADANFNFQCSATVRSRYEQIEATCVAQRDEEWWESRVAAWFQQSAQGSGGVAWIQYLSPVLQWASQITFVKDGISWQCCVPGLSKNTPKKTSHLLGGCIWEKSGQRGGIARARYAPSAIQDDGMCSRYFCIDDPAPQHEWQGHDGVFKQLIEWMEGSLLHGIEHFLLYNFDGRQWCTCRRHLQQVFGRLFGNQGALLIRRIPPRNIKRLFVSGQKSCAVVAYQHRCWRVHCLFTAWDEILQTLQVHSLSLQRIRFARAVANKIEILSVLRVPAVDGHDKDYPWLSKTHRTRWPRRVIHGVGVFDEGCPLTLSHGSGEVNCLFRYTTQLGFRNITAPRKK